MIRFVKTKFMKYAILVLCIYSSFSILNSQEQDLIKLTNPSFEGIPTCCQAPPGWTDCGFKGETPPDIQPALDQQNNPFFNVTKKPIDGDTYLGMVVRENETFERVSQKLVHPLRAGKCYSFSIMLCRSNTYLSASNRSKPSDLKQFKSPVVLRIWGGDAHCNFKELLATSPLIENTEWERYVFEFKTQAQLDYFLLEAFYDAPVIFPYNGNVLLDNASDILEIECTSVQNK